MTTQLHSAAVVLLLVAFGGCGGSSETAVPETAAAASGDSRAGAAPGAAAQASGAASAAPAPGGPGAGGEAAGAAAQTSGAASAAAAPGAPGAGGEAAGAASAAAAASAAPGAAVAEGQAGAGAGPAAASSAPAVTETRWLRGLWANDIRKALGPVNVTCTGPVMENRQSVWSCGSGTPLVTYKVLFYGSAPGKIEYITATVTQSDRPKDDLPLRVFVALAGLHFEGADPQKARAWVRDTIAAGGTTSFGPARFKLLGDERRRRLDIKAAGSEW